MLESAWVALGLALFVAMFAGGWDSKWRWYLVPFLPWLARSWFLLEPAKELRFLSIGVEGLRGFDGRRTLRSAHPLVLLFSLSCFAPVIGATTLADFLNALAFAVGMTLSLGYLNYYREDLARGVPVADQMLLVFTALAWFYKFAYGYQLGLSPLMVRGGGVYASNQYISIAICLLPFVRSRWLLLVVIGTIMLQFSRGGFVALALTFFLARMRKDKANGALAISNLVSARALAYGGLSVAAGVLLLALIAPDGFKFLLIRLVGGGAFGLNLEVADVFSRLPLTDLLQVAMQSAESDDRGLIWATAFRIASDNHLVGVGAGNFVVAASTLNAELLYSNAHNLYLTLLSELGLASLLLFVLMLAVYAVKAFRHSAAGFVALVTFIVYGMFSGQIYETSSEVSISQFIVLLFIFANIDSQRHHEETSGCPQ